MGSQMRTVQSFAQLTNRDSPLLVNAATSLMNVLLRARWPSRTWSSRSPAGSQITIALRPNIASRGAPLSTSTNALTPHAPFDRNVRSAGPPVIGFQILTIPVLLQLASRSEPSVSLKAATPSAWSSGTSRAHRKAEPAGVRQAPRAETTCSSRAMSRASRPSWMMLVASRRLAGSMRRCQSSSRIQAEPAVCRRLDRTSASRSRAARGTSAASPMSVSTSCARSTTKLNEHSTASATSSASMPTRCVTIHRRAYARGAASRCASSIKPAPRSALVASLSLRQGSVSSKASSPRTGKSDVALAEAR
mmetsp:Transcript_24678/g.97921  ORF Transcript_24678/g.97921 Transcript_24678/m.97921 type:complete len:306 (-) Transcript_24678:1039-1956(-)